MKLNTEILHKLTLSPTKVTPLTTITTTTTSPKTWVTFTYYNSMIRKLTKIFRNTNFKIAFRTNNTIHNSLLSRPYYSNIHSHSGIYQLQCHTRKLMYRPNRLYFNYDIKNTSVTSHHTTQNRHTPSISYTMHMNRDMETAVTLLHDAQTLNE
jgi:hypothetical protein